MRYGYCTGFATNIQDRIDDQLLENIKNAGFDYVELPLMLLAKLTPQQFTTLLETLRALGLAADASCNMFPAHVRLTGPDADPSAIQGYLVPAMERLAALGTKTLVFGSAPARYLPDGVSRAAGRAQLIRLIQEQVLPLLEKNGICLVMEPISSSDDNLLNTLADGMMIVREIGHPQVRLLADTVHLLYENEHAGQIHAFAPHLHHIHVCEKLRELPVRSYTPALYDYLQALRAIGYDNTISFEPSPYSATDMASALALLQAQFQ